MARILFLHGLEARPGGFKPQFLASQGFEVLNPGLPDDSFVDAVAIAQQEYDLYRPAVVVGSSRGAAVAMALELQPGATRSARGRVATEVTTPRLALHTPLVLIAPAWRWCGIDPRVGPRTIILHAAQDELIPVADSRELATVSELPPTALRIVGENHRMNDAEALAALVAAIREFLPRG